MSHVHIYLWGLKITDNATSYMLNYLRIGIEKLIVNKSTVDGTEPVTVFHLMSVSM